ncbi:MAG TPA: protein-L-isoaspartate(D-aspartate) O-methyltransferase [Sandaracinaceae bacterium LLY-WYZ-13_1]|nr:protein-L-isoaspartate(D-aspartate) O-methyltransferase [Sandaracinaceae bacterium LLY-WYZ-13_1]
MRARISLFALLLLGLATCSEEPADRAPPSASAGDEPAEASQRPASEASDDPSAERADERAEMVRTQLQARDVNDPDVLAAMRRVPRHRFVPSGRQRVAYADRPLPIGHDQTISQPYIVGLMTQLLEVEEGDRVLEIGTGSGYQAAVLAELGVEVYTIEIVEPLGERAARLLERLGYENVHTRIGDGYRGWPEHAPFDAVILTAAPPEIPEPLREQLAVGGRLVAPVGRGMQQLVVITRTEDGYRRERNIPVRFVPMTGEAQRR